MGGYAYRRIMKEKKDRKLRKILFELVADQSFALQSDSIANQRTQTVWAGFAF